jgi:hypothetical protein
MIYICWGDCWALLKVHRPASVVLLTATECLFKTPPCDVTDVLYILENKQVNALSDEAIN